MPAVEPPPPWPASRERWGRSPAGGHEVGYTYPAVSKMGDYSHLRIGDIVFTWKYHVPTFLTFVFKEEDLFIKREEVVVDPDNDEPVEVDPDELYIEEAGFRTTVGAAKTVLDEYGYTLEFFADIYGSFRPGLQETVRDVLDNEIGGQANEAGEDLSEEDLQRRIRAHLSPPQARRVL